jgi:hypothetical protein
VNKQEGGIIREREMKYWLRFLETDETNPLGDRKKNVVQ